jgi:hypothetical protein
MLLRQLAQGFNYFRLSIGSVVLSRLNLQQSVWYLAKGSAQGHLLFVAYMNGGKERELDTEALLGFYLLLHGCKPVE